MPHKFHLNLIALSWGSRVHNQEKTVTKQLKEDSLNGDIGAIQKVQNKMARFLNNKSLKDKIHTSELLNNINMLSVNQINAKVKIQEVWKALNVEGYPLKIDCQKASETSTSTRAMTSGRLIESGRSNLVSVLLREQIFNLSTKKLYTKRLLNLTCGGPSS